MQGNPKILLGTLIKDANLKWYFNRTGSFISWSTISLFLLRLSSWMRCNWGICRQSLKASHPLNSQPCLWYRVQVEVRESNSQEQTHPHLLESEYLRNSPLLLKREHFKMSLLAWWSHNSKHSLLLTKWSWTVCQMISPVPIAASELWMRGFLTVTLSEESLPQEALSSWLFLTATI